MSNTSSNSLQVRRLTYAAMCLALALLLPFLTGQNQKLGSMLCLMHIPVLLCGFLCGWPWGLAVGFVAPLLRSVIFGMPPMPVVAVPMAFELATYGAVAGLLYRKFPKTIPGIYASLVIAMIAGRVVWGIAKLILCRIMGTEFVYFASVAEAFATALLGIGVQLVLIPAIVYAMEKAGLNLNKA